MKKDFSDDLEDIMRSINHSEKLPKMYLLNCKDDEYMSYTGRKISNKNIQMFLRNWHRDQRCFTL
jgi:hypothetical protein